MISTASAYTLRLAALAKLTNRPIIRTRLPVPQIEMRGYGNCLMREIWLRKFGSLIKETK